MVTQRLVAKSQTARSLCERSRIGSRRVAGGRVRVHETLPVAARSILMSIYGTLKQSGVDVLPRPKPHANLHHHQSTRAPTPSHNFRRLKGTSLAISRVR